ncbi:hypothetical protein [Nonomuraea longicatena]|uniref:WIF domain-containing protein n=1 Tax=Nonomuraea longicatena TaxID=83682 RepID=A0ABN1PYY0_9ACTN
MTITLSRLTRAAADGARLTIEVPQSVGTLHWSGLTKLAGPGFARAFTLTQRGGNKALPTHVFPGGRVETFRRQGYDLTLYEAADRSDSCLVWVGPYNEAKTWFNGPAPRRSVLNTVLAAVDFADGPDGAVLRARRPSVLHQFATTVIGAGDGFQVIATDARATREALPDWQGATRGDSEVWRVALDLDPDEKQRLAGTPYEWKYTFANASAVYTVHFIPEPGPGALRAADGTLVDDVLSGLRVTWAA